MLTSWEQIIVFRMTCQTNNVDPLVPFTLKVKSAAKTYKKGIRRTNSLIETFNFRVQNFSNEILNSCKVRGCPVVGISVGNTSVLTPLSCSKRQSKHATSMKSSFFFQKAWCRALRRQLLNVRFCVVNCLVSISTRFRVHVMALEFDETQ